MQLDSPDQGRSDQMGGQILDENFHEGTGDIQGHGEEVIQEGIQELTQTADHLGDYGQGEIIWIWTVGLDDLNTGVEVRVQGVRTELGQRADVLGVVR